MRPWIRDYTMREYDKFWKILPATYEYKVLFFEKEGHAQSTKDKFPITLSDKTICTKDDFVKIVQEAFEPINSYNLGLNLKYAGYDITDKENIAFDMQDNVNAITYFWKPTTGGLAAPMSQKGFGIEAYLGDRIGKDWYIGVLRHEFTHCMNFTHKDIYFKGLSHQPVISGLDGKGEFTADTLHGFKTLYGVDSKFKIIGIVEDFNEKNYEYIEVFVTDRKTKEILYQSPIDWDGYFEFRIDLPLKQFKILVVGKEKNKYYRYKITKKHKLNRWHKHLDFCFSLDGEAANLEDVARITKTKIS